MKVSGYPTVTEVIAGTRRLPNIGASPSGGMIYRLMRRVEASIDRGFDRKLLLQLYSDPSFALRSGFMPDSTRVAFSSDGREHGIQLLTEGRPAAKIKWDYSALDADRPLFAPYEWSFKVRIGEGGTLDAPNLHELRKALDRPLVKPAENVSKGHAGFDHVSWMGFSGVTLLLGGLSQNVLAVIVSVGAVAVYPFLAKARRGTDAEPMDPVVGLSDPVTLYRLMSADLESAQRYADLAKRAEHLRSAFGETIDVGDIEAMTALDRTLPRLIESCLATIETLQSETDRRGVLAETATAIDDTLHVAETRLAARDKEAIAGHRDVLAGARLRMSDHDAPHVLH